MEAVDILHIVERLSALSQVNPGPDPDRDHEVATLLHQAGLDNGASGYTAEKLSIVRERFSRWFGPAGGASDSSALRRELQHDIEHMKKALTRHSTVQD